MNLLDDLLASLKEDAPVRSVLVGAHWTVVCSRGCGMASTVTGHKPHGEDRVRDVGRLHKKSAKELAELARSNIALEASIGLAAINSLVEVDEAQAVEIDAGDLLIRRGQGKSVALVGHFPFIPALRQTARDLWVIEQHPTADEHPAGAASEILPQADIVALTGSTLINQTLEGLLALCKPGALVMVLGPSTPLSPVWFEHGVSLISGSQVIDEEAVIRTVGQGATFQQVEGVRKLTLSVSGIE